MISTINWPRLLENAGVKKSPRLAQLIRDRRLGLNWSQEDLAKTITLAGTPVSREAIGSIESGRVELPGREVLRGLSKALSIPMTQILEAADYLSAEDMPNPPEVFAAHADKLTDDQWVEVTSFAEYLIEKARRLREQEGRES